MIPGTEVSRPPRGVQNSRPNRLSDFSFFFYIFFGMRDFGNVSQLSGRNRRLEKPLTFPGEDNLSVKTIAAKNQTQ